MSNLQSKRILVDGTHLSIQMKGVGRYVANTLWQLSKLDSTNEYWILVREDVKLPSLPQNTRFHYVPIRLWNHFFHGMWSLPRRARLHRTNLAWVPYETTIGFFSCPYLVTCHDVPDMISQAERAGGKRFSLVQHLTKLADGYIHRQSLHSAAVVFCNSFFVKEWLYKTRGIPTARILYAPCAPGADFASITQTMDCEAIRLKLGCPSGYLLAFATGDKRENVDTVFRVYDQLVSLGLKQRLIVAGVRQSDRPDMIEGISRYRWQKRALILPFYGEDQTRNLAEVYAGADVYLDLSLHEGFGMQVVEAMASGTAVVCSNAGAIPEVAGDAAVLVDACDANAIARALSQILDDLDLRYRLAKRGQQQAAKYTWRQTATTILEAFETLA